MFGRGRGRGRGKAAQQAVLVPVPVLVEDVWVQCDNPDCKKWRKLPPGCRAPEDDVEWFCSMNSDPVKNSCSAPEEDYEDKDWEAREAQVKAQVAALQQQGQLPLDKTGGMPMLQAPLMMYSSGLAGYGKRPAAGAGDGRPRKRGKPDGLPAKYFPTHMDEMAALEVAFQAIMDNGGLFDDAYATKEAATAAAATSAAAAAAAAAADEQAGAPAPPHARLALPLWVWNGLQSYAPDAAEVACQAVDLVTAALSVCGPCQEQREQEQRQREDEAREAEERRRREQEEAEQQQQDSSSRRRSSGGGGRRSSSS
ncbi:MAG: hypothetical protein J3K34DRAFT_151153 [Monoraphidium minutum]|nr:MAG: hypothetical protein J3K34DRAFT_151153 [Monoraphidium minutum]